MKNFLPILCVLLLHLPVRAQTTFPVNGVHDQRHLYHAFTNAIIHVSPGHTLWGASLLIKDGKVIEAGSDVKFPGGTVVHDCTDMHIYASFIDAYAGFNVIKPKKNNETPAKSGSTATNWNPAIRPEYKYNPIFPLDEKTKEDWLAGGTGIVNVHHRDGIMRGSAALFHLGIDRANDALIKSVSSHHYSFSKGSSTVDYPSSHMGAVALIRQSFYDAVWYGSQSVKEEINLSLESLQHTEGSRIFELNHPLSYRNVAAIGKEFGMEFILKGTGREYLVAKELAPATRIIAPTVLPKAYDIEDPLDARLISLEELKHWEAAPFNLYFLLKHGHQVSLTRDTIKNHRQFISAFQKIGASGTGHDQLLASLTTSPANFLGIGTLAGKLEKGMIANFFITPEDLMSKGFVVYEHWNKGELVYTKPAPNTALLGTYNLVIEKIDYTLNIEKINEKGVKASLHRKDNDSKLQCRIKIQDELITLVILTGDKSPNLMYQLSGKSSLGGALLDGTGKDAKGKVHRWAAVRDRASAKKALPADSSDSATVVRVPTLGFPNTSFGFDTLPVGGSFVITNATVWTNTEQGVLDRADIWVENGKIRNIGTGMLYPSGLKRIDAKGRHVTAGIIDEHSHIGLRGGVNEWAQASSAEVRIEDAIDPWSIQIYRQLAGGVTAAQLLHGSANPIGGQSAIVKLKWGHSAEDMLIDDAPGFIKFALGENVKRSNSHNHKNRFPLTRMGVEQSFIDAFTRAREYAQATQSTVVVPGKKGSPSYTKPNTVRKDLELEALVEILHEERYITCHSYVQSEILMLMEVADSFGFTVNTFTHILEGYKVAPEMKSHGAGASTFSDWWAYKYEVNDAIPYNAALLTKAGVVTAINSDDAEMGRRLNQEAAKAMKYGGLEASEAIKLVTINPAKLLHIDHRTGSLEAGKDADLVVWSGHPLSVYSHAQLTFIEGVLYYDYGKQDEIQLTMEAERSRIIALMLLDKSAGKQPVKAKGNPHYHCDTLLEDYELE